VTMTALDHPLVGELVRWSRDGNVLVGLAGGYDDDRDSIVLLAGALRELSVVVPAVECRLAGPGTGTVGVGLADGPMLPGERDAYLRGLVDARSSVALVAAELAMSGDVLRCSGVARAFETLDDLVRVESGE
jgi:hypothetical protein